jgi:hypothetical protein
MRKQSKTNEKVWEILTEDEKSALLLSINHGKSTWQAGEIMNKAHYKYLEIQARANQFFKMFTEYFRETNNLRIPESCNLSPDFRDFIIATIFERKTSKEAIDSIQNSPFIISSARDRIMGEYLNKLGNSDDFHDNLLYDLIIEFDRWNNFRVLPIVLQEPSAFKRRNKNRLIKHLKNLARLDEYHVTRFMGKFKETKNRKGYYVALISDNFDYGYEVVKITRKPRLLEYISKDLRIYIFKEQIEADEFGLLVTTYLGNKERDCRVGQVFWAKYRNCIAGAHNYLEVNNIIPRRKNLENAFKDMDSNIIKRSMDKINNISDPAKRAESKNFWVI